MMSAYGVDSPRILFLELEAGDHPQILALLRAAKMTRVTAVSSLAAVPPASLDHTDCVVIRGKDCLPTIEELQAKWNPPTPAIVVLGEHDTPEAAVDMLRGGAQDYLPLSRLTTELLANSIQRAIHYTAGDAELARRNRPLPVGEQMVESEATIRALFEHASQGILMADIRGQIVEANAMMEELFGYSRSELRGQPVEVLLPQRFRSQHVKNRANYSAEPRPRPMGRSQELSARRKDGSEFPVEISLSHIVTKRGGLAVAFVSDITERKRVESALRESEVRFQTFMDNNPASAFIKNAEGNLVWTNRAYQRLFNMPPARYLGKTVFDLWPPEVAERLRANELIIMDSGQPQEFLDTLPSQDGVERRFISFKFTFRGSSQQTMLGGMLVDVTERQQAEESIRVALLEKTILLKEVHHRVKNNLAVVSSLLAMQAATANGTAAQALADSQSRIQSMALVHEYLYASEQLDRVDFKEYTCKLASEISYAFDLGSRQLRLHVEAEPVQLGLDRAIPCGLILNELVSNAVKYGFPDNRQGEVRVEIHRPDPSRLLLAVADDGVGLPAGLDWRNADSLGLRIVQLLTKQLDGSIDLVAGAGTRFELLIPQGDTV